MRKRNGEPREPIPQHRAVFCVDTLPRMEKVREILLQRPDAETVRIAQMIGIGTKAMRSFLEDLRYNSFVSMRKVVRTDFQYRNRAHCCYTWIGDPKDDLSKYCIRKRANSRSGGRLSKNPCGYTDALLASCLMPAPRIVGTPRAVREKHSARSDRRPSTWQQTYAVEFL